VDSESVFDLEPAAAHWLAETFEDESAQHALLGSLAMSAEAETAARGAEPLGGGQDARPLLDLLSEQKVGEIVGDVVAAFPDLPIPREPGRAQLRAIDRLIRQGSRERAPGGKPPSRQRAGRVRTRVGVVRTRGV
jgi:hypothetical protein